jgi:hypothetical protein
MQKNSWHFGGDAPAKISSFGKEQSQFPAPIRPRKLLDHVRDVLRVNHYLLRTEEAYVGWIRRFILFNHPGGDGSIGSGNLPDAPGGG